jgi:hypothetical protein
MLVVVSDIISTTEILTDFSASTMASSLDCGDCEHRSSLRFQSQGAATMFDETVRLHENPHLLALLTNYAQQGVEDRTTWRDRVMEMEGVDSKQLTALHGELMACDWIEQNTGQARLLPNGILSACYRITLNGLREYRQIQGIEMVVEPAETQEKKTPKFPRKKQKSESPEVVVVSTSDESSEETLAPAA